MSYILDALKKAERDRRHARVPSLGTMHTVPAERRPIWPWIAGGVLVLNAVGFAVVLALRPAATEPSAPAPAPAAAVAAPVTSTAPTTSGGSSAPSRPDAPPATTAPDHRPAKARPDETAARSEPTRAPAAPAKDARAEPEALKLEILVYSDRAAERAAYINGQRYVEGDRVDGQRVVEQITRDGVILAAQGKRYLLKQP